MRKKIVCVFLQNYEKFCNSLRFDYISLCGYSNSGHSLLVQKMSTVSLHCRFLCNFIAFADFYHSSACSWLENFLRNKSVKYLGMYLSRRLTWIKHIKIKRKAMDLKLRKIYWLDGRKSQIFFYNKLIIYKVIIKPVWPAWDSNLDIIQRFQSKTLRLMLDFPWYVTNAAIHRDLEIETVKKEIERYSEHYEERFRTHPTELATNLLNRYLVVRRL